MKEKGVDQRCTTIKVLGNGNWEECMWPHQIDKTPRLDSEFITFLNKLNLSKLTGIFESEEVLNLEVLLSLNEEHLEKIGIKLGDRISILKETSKLKQQPTVKPQEKMTPVTPVKSPAAACPPPVRRQLMNAYSEVKTRSQEDAEAAGRKNEQGSEKAQMRYKVGDYHNFY